MTKSPEMVSFLDQLSLDMYGRSRSESLAKGICVVCGKPADSFDDLIARKEYYISALCQLCQDETFQD
jgi:hypothetical protein